MQVMNAGPKAERLQEGAKGRNAAGITGVTGSVVVASPVCDGPFQGSTGTLHEPEFFQSL
jgi:hypothetical protein